jgi:hypothetical protein
MGGLTGADACEAFVHSPVSRAFNLCESVKSVDPQLYLRPSAVSGFTLMSWLIPN